MTENKTTQREWHAGDPEPQDVERVRDTEGDIWINQGAGSWYALVEDPEYAVAWSVVLRYAPLVEVAPPSKRDLSERDHDDLTTAAHLVHRVMDRHNGDLIGPALAAFTQCFIDIKIGERYLGSAR